MSQLVEKLGQWESLRQTAMIKRIDVARIHNTHFINLTEIYLLEFQTSSHQWFTKTAHSP